MAELSKPPLPRDTRELEEFLVSLDSLPVHDFRKGQRLWPRHTDPELLFQGAVCSLHVDIAVERNQASGELEGYREVDSVHTGLTARNSTSLQRAPGPSALSVKGDPTNYPFWPAGLDSAGAVDTVLSEGLSASSMDFETGLLSVAPGFSEGVDLCGGVVVPLPSSRGGQPAAVAAAVGVAEVLFRGEDILSWVESGDTGTEEEHKIAGDLLGKPEPEAATPELLNETLEGVLGEEKAAVVNGRVLGSDQEGDEERWSVKVDLQSSVDDFNERVPNLAHEWEFKLDPFQKQAVLHLESHECVFVAAHTSAGKTVVAEYAIALAMGHNTRVIYTSPIKALSNQKFRDFRITFGEDKIGLLTGDVQIRSESPCLIMTTEILRSMLYNGSEVVRDLEWVIFDEVHYINDAERGVVWEEVLIMLPEHVGIIMLSATVPNALEFADWVGRTQRKKMYVISTVKRPVPLVHHLYTGTSRQTSDQLYQLVGKDHKFLTKGYQAALMSKKPAPAKSGAAFGAKFKDRTNPKHEKNIWLGLVRMLQKDEKLPVVAFTFSRNRCDSNADALSSLDLTTSIEKSAIHVFFQKSVKLLEGSDSKLPQVLWMRDLLRRGLAVHHSGILPIIKEVIELLFQRSLVKLLFATETFAMGVNMPARTVVFDSTRKHDGVQMRDLYPGEYIQMAGRAGRRGKDKIGTVILLCKGDVPEASDLHKMILGLPTPLESQFRLTYSMLLNIMRVETLRVEDMMKRSFAEVDTARHKRSHQQSVESLQLDMRSLTQLNCPVCTQDIDQYYSVATRIAHLQKEMQAIFLSSPHVLKALSPGRLVVIFSCKYKYSLAVVLQQNVKKTSKTLTVVTLCDPGDQDEAISKQIFSATPPPNLYEPFSELFLPVGQVEHTVVEIDASFVVQILSKTIQVDPPRIIENYRKRQIPRFQSEMPSPAVVQATQCLVTATASQATSSPASLPALNPVRDLKVTNMDYVAMGEERLQLEAMVQHHTCVRCPLFKEHFEVACKKAELKEKLSVLRFKLSEDSLRFLPEYKQRLQVLSDLGYHRGTVELKGRVACEIHSNAVLITELLFQNVLSQYSAAEIVALLSCVVFQQANCAEPNLTENLKKGKEAVIDVATQVALKERELGLDSSVEESIKELKFGLVEVVYEWANGLEFIKLIELTDVSEGMIVRCIQRLNETCRDVRNAARVIGDPVLKVKMQDASTLIKRGIVFAASLYTK